MKAKRLTSPRTLASSLAVVLSLLGSLGCSSASPEPKTEPRTSEFFATRQGSTITLHPTTATFQVSDAMCEWFAEYKNNLHLSPDELAKVEHGAGEWDTEYGLVCNAALPFARCCAHVGEEGWGRDGVSYGDLQVRVYVLDKTLDEVGHDIADKAAAKVKQITEAPAEVATDKTAPWKRWDFAYNRWYGDYGATAHVDFRARQFDDDTVIFVFMYTDYTSQDAEIRAMLRSFMWGGQPNGKSKHSGSATSSIPPAR